MFLVMNVVLFGAIFAPFFIFMFPLALADMFLVGYSQKLTALVFFFFFPSEFITSVQRPANAPGDSGAVGRDQQPRSKISGS